MRRKKGTKTWRYEFRLDGKKQKYHYGNYPEITLDNARKIHAVARQLVELGKLRQHCLMMPKPSK